MVMQKKPLSIGDVLSKGYQAFDAGDMKTAEACCQKVLSSNPNIPQAHFLVGLIAFEAKERRVAASAFNTVTKQDPKNAGAWAHLAKLFSEMGYTVKADEALRKAESLNPQIPMVYNVLGLTSNIIGDHEKAVSWFKKAYMSNPRNTTYGTSLANAQSFMGNLEEAEETIKAVLEVNNTAAEAHWVLSGLRKATDDSHAKFMEELADTISGRPVSEAFLRYGAGKEYEDLGEWEKAFNAFSRGAKVRRTVIEYDEEKEKELFTTLHKHYTHDWYTSSQSEADSSAPIFIIGQPRTGTTLIERVVTSHSKVHSGGGAAAS